MSDDFEKLADILKRLTANGHIKTIPRDIADELTALGVYDLPDPSFIKDTNRYKDILDYCSEPMRDQEFFTRARKDIQLLAVEAIELRKVVNGVLLYCGSFNNQAELAATANYFRAWRADQEKQEANTGM